MRRVCILWLAAVLCGAWYGAMAQSASQVRTLTFTVTDEQGHAVRDLRQNQFTILDDGKPPRLILNFEPQSVVPLRLALLLQAGDSDAARFAARKNEAAEFLRHAIRPQSDQAIVFSFDESATVEQVFTGDQQKLANAIRRIAPGKGSAVWDAVYAACKEALMPEQNPLPARRIMVLVANGTDQGSHVRPQEALEMAQRAQVTVYVITIGLSNAAGDPDLLALVEATGGRVFFPGKQAMAGALAEIAAELRTQYMVTYAPADPTADGRFHSISLVAENKKLKVRAPKGYFAPKR